MFMTSKNQEIYEHAFLAIKTLFLKNKLNVKLKSINMDYEKAMQNSWCAYFPEIKIVGCYFHLVLKKK